MRTDDSSSSTNVTVAQVPGGTNTVPWRSGLTAGVAAREAGFDTDNMEIRIDNVVVDADAPVQAGQKVLLLEAVTGNR